MSSKTVVSNVLNQKNEAINANDQTIDLVELADILISTFAALHSAETESDHE